MAIFLRCIGDVQACAQEGWGTGGHASVAGQARHWWGGKRSRVAAATAIVAVVRLCRYGAEHPRQVRLIVEPQSSAIRESAFIRRQHQVLARASRRSAR